MKKLSKIFVSAILILAVFASSVPSVLACGPFTVDPLFSFTKHLDYPIANFSSEKIGVVPETYGRISLYVYYRQLNNLPLTEKEKSEVARAISYRIGTHWSEDSDAGTKPPTLAPASTDKINPYTRWTASRAKITGEEIKTSSEKQDADDYSFYTNCLSDAYTTATNTLESRVAKYGTNDDVKNWLKGQDAVFSNCSAQGTLPEDAAANAPGWLKNDRQYQIAAALFYQEKFPDSRKTFEQIAADDSSVWKNTAKFVLARTYIRQASLIDDSDEATTDAAAKKSKQTEKADLLKKADDQFENILSDVSMKDFHDSAHRLLNLVRYRGNPLQQRNFLADKLVQPAENTDIYNNLTDYVWLLDKVESDAREKGIEIDQKQAELEKKQYDYNYRLKIRDIGKDELGKDLSDWLYSYQAADSFEHCYDKWKETGKLSWFVGALTKVKNDSPKLGELLTEAEKIQSGSPAYANVRYHLIQSLLESNKRAEAKRKLDEVFNTSYKTFSRSTQNKFLAQRMILAGNLEEFLKYAQRQPATFVWSDDANEEGTDLKDDKEDNVWAQRVMFDEDSVAFFNERMPLSVLRQAALSPNLPDYLKKFLVDAVWTRAFALNNQEIESEFAPLVQRYDQELAGAFTKLSNVTNPTEREAAMLLIILNNPVMQPFVPVGMGRSGTDPGAIDSIRGNWWCIADENSEDNSRYDHYTFVYPTAYPDFLTVAQKSAAAQEHKQLIASGASATFLARRALNFATKNPSHPNTPEIMHLAVRSTRYGCKDDSTLKFSKANFDLLHKSYPNNEWTKKTPYYFGNNQ